MMAKKAQPTLFKDSRPASLNAGSLCHNNIERRNENDQLLVVEWSGPKWIHMAQPSCIYLLDSLDEEVDCKK